MSVAIRCEGLSKAYQIGEFSTGTLSQDIERAWLRFRGKEDPFLKIGEENDRRIKGSGNIVWSLRDISFDIHTGDAVGIIGRNGAGKSTLLKVLSKVTSPTTGKALIKGRIASLLEVGTGFHPELTGRENIFLNGAILGMRKHEIKKKFDEIVEFAGIEKYIDTPVKRYSSGMYVRLAFSVAAHLESETLIVDEVLAVGDAQFQKKCLGKMGEVSQSSGRTILFVSHNMDAISRLCGKSIYLKNGRLLDFGNTEKIISTYLNDENDLTPSKEYVNLDEAPGDSVVKLMKSEVVDEYGNNALNLPIGKKMGVRMEFEVLEDTNDLRMGFNLYNQMDTHILSSHANASVDFFYKKGRYSTIVWIPANFLAEGVHYCGVAAMSYKPFQVHFHDIKKFNFNVVDGVDQGSVRGEYAGVFPGVIRPQLNWEEVQRIN